MKKTLIFLLFLSVTLPCFAQSINETITITTYYPSPHGVYGVLTLWPKKDEPESARPGDMYFNSGNNTVLIFVNETARWQQMGIGGTAGGHRDGDVIYNQTLNRFFVYNQTNDKWTETAYPASYASPPAGNSCQYIHIEGTSSCDSKCNSMGMECFESSRGTCSFGDCLSVYGGCNCKCCTLAPHTETGQIITVSGTNPTCPLGTTEISRYWMGRSYFIYECIAGSIPEGWNSPDMKHTYSCSSECGDCTVKKACCPFTCECTSSQWTMVKCQNN